MIDFDAPPAATFGEPLASHGDAPSKVFAALVELSAAAFLDFQGKLQREEGFSAAQAAAVVEKLWPKELERLRAMTAKALRDMASTAEQPEAGELH